MLEVIRVDNSCKNFQLRSFGYRHRIAEDDSPRMVGGSGSGFREFVEGAAQEVEEVVEQVERDREEKRDDDDGYRRMRGGEPG